MTPYAWLGWAHALSWLAMALPRLSICREPQRAAGDSPVSAAISRALGWAAGPKQQRVPRSARKPDRLDSRRAALDAIVVLGCRVLPGGKVSGPLARRVQRAAAAFQSGASPRLVVSGGRRWHGYAEAEALRDALVQLAVPEDRVLLELKSMSTAENAYYVAELLRPLGIQSLGLVSCDYHLPRAERCFRRAGFEVTRLPAATPKLPWFRRALRQLSEATSERLDPLCTWGSSMPGISR